MKETGEKRRRLGGREATAAQIPGAYAISVGDTGTPLPQGWKRHLLSGLARMESGHTPSRRHPEYWGGSIPWIGIRDATSNHGRTIYETNENTNALGIANSASRVLPKDTVCLSRTASVGYVVVMGREMATSQDFANWICGPDLDYRYLKYALIAEGDALLNFASGSVHQTIYFPELKSFHIAAPEKPEQGAIADILSALDDKIELNRQTNETLEGMAQAIFRDWFVDFGPTRRKAAGEANPVAIMGGLTPNPARAAELAALFPAAFGDDALPMGWSKQSIYADASVIYGAPFASKRFNSDGIGRPLVRIRDLPRHGSELFTDEVHSREYVIQPGDIVVGMDGTFRARVWQGIPSLMNQRLCCFQPKSPAARAFVYFSIKPTLDQMEKSAVGTTVIHLGKGDIDRFTTIDPGEELIAAFGGIAEVMLDRLTANGLENRTLAETRDYLMPRLMSGAVRVAPKVEAS